MQRRTFHHAARRRGGDLAARGARAFSTSSTRHRFFTQPRPLSNRSAACQRILLLVALPLASDLLLFAKHLFVAAKLCLQTTGPRGTALPKDAIWNCSLVYWLL